MSKYRFISRAAIVVAVVVVSGILISGFLLWLHVVTWQPDPADAPSEFDAKRVQAFLQRHMLKVPRSEPSKAVDDVQLLLLGNDVSRFRESAVKVADTKALTELPEVLPGAFQDILAGKISAQFPYIWPYVIAGSFIVIGNSLGNEPVVAFYNPYFDTAILTKWRFNNQSETKTTPGFKLVQALAVTGRAFRENRPSLATDQPVWSDAKDLFEVRIVNAAQSFVASFEERYPPFGRASSVNFLTRSDDLAVSVAENRVFSLLRWVIDAQNPNAPVNYAAAIKDLRGALEADTAKELDELLPKDNPQKAASFFQLNAEIRAGMKPYLVVDKNVIFIDPINLPTGFISVYFKPADGEYVPGLMALFNLEANYVRN